MLYYSKSWNRFYIFVSFLWIRLEISSLQKKVFPYVNRYVLSFFFGYVLDLLAKCFHFFSYLFIQHHMLVWVSHKEGIMTNIDVAYLLCVFLDRILFSRTQICFQHFD